MSDLQPTPTVEPWIYGGRRQHQFPGCLNRLHLNRLRTRHGFTCSELSETVRLPGLAGASPHTISPG